LDRFPVKVGLAPAHRRAIRQWPEEKWAALIPKILSSEGWTKAKLKEFILKNAASPFPFRKEGSDVLSQGNRSRQHLAGTAESNILLWAQASKRSVELCCVLPRPALLLGFCYIVAPQRAEVANIEAAMGDYGIGPGFFH